jgi:DNA-binding CsgD family transcriptional regulator/tetratricopeptide (TPR) repeat protein
MTRRVTSPIFVGRSNEAAVLRAAVLAGGDGRPSITLVAGDAGVGKTRLIRAVEEQVRAEGAFVLRGECLALSGDFPYAPIVGALRDAGHGLLAGALDRLPPESRSEIGRLVPEITAQLDGGTTRLNQGRLFELLLSLLRHLGDEAPVLFVIEDGHWADASTRDFLSFLARNLSSERVAAVVTYRPDEVSPDHPLRVLLSELIRCATVMSITLEPLGTAEIQRLIEHIVGSAAGVALVEEIFARSQGNPFFAEELLAARRAADRDPLPASLRDALLVRCQGLDADALRLLRILAVLGRPAPQDQLGALARIDEPRLSTALRTALAAHVIAHRTHDDTFEFRHALVREAVCSDLLPGERTALHRSIAETLAAGGAGTPAELAFHWDVAGEPAPALEASIRAGLEAEHVYASAEARQHFERAVRLWTACEPPAQSVPLDRVELLRHTAEAARSMGDWDSAVARSREAVALVDADAEPLRAALLYERVGEYLLWDDEGALTCYSTALALLPAGCRRERARILGAKALALHFLQSWEAARDCGQEALDEARRAGARTEEGYAANVLGLALAFLGEHAQAEDHVRTAKRIAEEGGGAEDAARACAHLAEVLRIRGNFAGALDVMRHGEELASRMGMANSFGGVMSVNAAEDLLRLGRWDEAAERLRFTDRLELSVLAELLQSSVQGRLAAGRGARDDARAHLHRARGRCDARTPVGYVVGPYAGLAELALWDGRPEDARDEVAEAFALIAGREEPLYVPVLFWLGARANVDVALAARPHGRGRDLTEGGETAARLCAALERLIARYSSTDAPADAEAYLALCRAELTRLTRGPPEAWTVAAEAWRRLEHPYLHAYASWRDVEGVLGGGHPRGEAAARLRATRAVVARLDARPLLREIDALARAARIDVSAEPAAPPGGEPSSADRLGLTAREMDVLALIVEGCTNRGISQRLFISEKTAGVHVSHILAKLGAENRVRAAAIAHRLGLLDTYAVSD